MSYAVPRIFSPLNYNSAYCHVQYGVFKATIIGGYTVREMRHALSGWNLPPNAKAFINGTELPEDRIVKARQYVEFHKPR